MSSNYFFQNGIKKVLPIENRSWAEYIFDLLKIYFARVVRVFTSETSKQYEWQIKLVGATKSFCCLHKKKKTGILFSVPNMCHTIQEAFHGDYVYFHHLKKLKTNCRPQMRKSFLFGDDLRANSSKVSFSHLQNFARFHCLYSQHSNEPSRLVWEQVNLWR